MIAIIPEKFETAFCHYTVRVDGIVVACCGTLHHARKIAEQKRKEILEKLIQGA